jgi:uncharacterized membrane protein YhaH (DUF805 family)
MEHPALIQTHYPFQFESGIVQSDNFWIWILVILILLLLIAIVIALFISKEKEKENLYLN